MASACVSLMVWCFAMDEPRNLPLVPPDVVDSALSRVSFAEPHGFEPMDSIIKAVVAVIGGRYYIPLRQLRAGLYRMGCTHTRFNGEPYYRGIVLRTEGDTDGF